MGCDSNLFVKDGVNIHALKNYIEGKYGDTNLSIENDHYATLSFTDGEDSRNMSVYLYLHDVEDGCPVKQVAGKSVMLTLSKWGRSVEILEDIGKNFCGGYLRENDCDEEKPWRIVENVATPYPSQVEAALYGMICKDKPYTLRTDFNDDVIIDFVLRHLDEIKKL